MIFSTNAWIQIQPIYQAIIALPFNQELAQGTLSRDRFAYYIEQDALYLKHFARALALIAGRASNSTHIQALVSLSQGALLAESEVVHDFFRKHFGFQATGQLTPATVGYTSYLLQSCALDPIEVSIAALLPCFWIYREVGLHIAQHSTSENPYSRWIETYSGPEFDSSVKKMIHLCNDSATQTTEPIRAQMLEAFQISTRWEWYFWEEAYQHVIFDPLNQGS